jgi:hypothetical protein
VASDGGQQPVESPRDQPNDVIDLKISCTSAVSAIAVAQPWKTPSVAVSHRQWAEGKLLGRLELLTVTDSN